MKPVYLIAAFLVSIHLYFARESCSQTQLVLQQDQDFGSEKLETSGPDSRILDFAVIGESVYYTDYQDLGPETRVYLREMGVTDSRKRTASSIVPGCKPRYLDNSGSVLRSYELESRTLNSYDPLTGAVVHSQPANYIVESKTFLGGGMIASVNLLGHLYEKVLTQDQIREMSGKVPRREFQEFLAGRSKRAYELGKYEVALLGTDLEVKMPLLPLYKHEEIVDGVDRRSSLDQGLYPQRIRISPSRTIAAVFRKHMPGITLFTEDGSTLAQVPSPGTGIKVAEDGPFPGRTILFQNDVVVAADHLLVADNARHAGDERSYVIWKVGFDGEVSAMYASPYFVTRMEAAGGYLYLLGREKQFARYRYP